MSSDDLSLSAMLNLSATTDDTTRALRDNQLQALIRLVPATISVQLLAAIVTCAALWNEVPHWQLLIWLAGSLIICLTRGLRAWRLRSDPDYARRKPADLRTVTLIITALALLWLVPPFMWFPLVRWEEQLLLCVVTVGLMSAGSYSLASVPQAAITYVAVLAVGTLVIAVYLDSPVQFTLGILYAVALGWAVLANARQFAFNVLTRLELQEHGQIVNLLREFDASGSDWLWELDRRQRFVRVSRALARAFGSKPSELVGKPAMQVLDPDGRTSVLSSGMRSLFEHAALGASFRDVAIPMFGGRQWWTVSGKPLHDEHGVLVGWRGVGSDITEARLSGSDAVRAARRDPLTGIGNRLLVREQLEEGLLRQQAGSAGCALLLVDLDRFKLVNDTLGHAVGDQLLCEVARRLERCAGIEACVARLGGDEFALVWTGDCNRDVLARLATEVCTELERAVTVGTAHLHVGATIGIARGGEDAATEDGLMSAADLALYSAKKAGRGSHAFFEPIMLQRAEEHRRLENDVRDALATNALSLVYQDIVDARTGKLLAREALLRWQHPTRGEVLPDEFIGMIEDIGLIHQIGAWVMRNALAEAATWPSDIDISVNVSGSQLGASDFLGLVVSTLAATGIKANRVQLEVTENIFLGEDTATFATLSALRGLGVQLVLDDFGSGYCSFGYLRRTRFSKLKIDQSFVRAAAAGDSDCLAIVEAVVALARTLGMRVTAEGIEEEAEAELMRAIGCDELQGFHLGRPSVLAASGEGDTSSSAHRRRA